MGTGQEGLLTVDEAARQLKLSVRSLRRKMAEGRITYLRLGRSVRFDPADLAAYRASCRVKATAGPELAGDGVG